MTKRFLLTITMAAILTITLTAGNAAAQAGLPPDLTGLYKSFPAGGTEPNGDLTSRLVPGSELILTPFGAERYKKVDVGSGDPGAKCLPGGPLRGLWGLGHPFMIVQHPSVVVIHFESQGGPRFIYTDGRSHPEDIYDLPEFMGNSVGKWEGDTLVVDTVAVDERIWLDPSGHEHSDKLRLIERFQKTGPNTIKWEATIDDPVFFVKPFTVTRTFERQINDRILSHSCIDNEKDLEYMVPELGGTGHPKMQDEKGNVTRWERPDQRR
jgi:hypothetical protein